MSRRDRPLLCQLGLHRKSKPLGGVRVCKRERCDHVETYGVVGIMREIRWRDDLRESYERLRAERETVDGGETE